MEKFIGEGFLLCMILIHFFGEKNLKFRNPSFSRHFEKKRDYYNGFSSFYFQSRQSDHTCTEHQHQYPMVPPVYFGSSFSFS